MKELPNLKPLNFINSGDLIHTIMEEDYVDLSSLNSSGLHFSTFKTSDFLSSMIDNGETFSAFHDTKNKVKKYCSSTVQLSKKSTASGEVNAKPLTFINSSSTIRSILKQEKNIEASQNKLLLKGFNFRVSKNQIIQILK